MYSVDAQCDGALKLTYETDTLVALQVTRNCPLMGAAMSREIRIETAILVVAFCHFARGDGACCFTNNACLMLTQANCSVIPNSYWAGEGSDCTDLDANGMAEDCQTSLPSLTFPKIYWIDTNKSRIQRANLDGSQVENVLTGLDSPRGLTIDMYTRKLYWTSDGPQQKKIFRSNLDGTGVEQVLLTSAFSGAGLGPIEIDSQGGKFYWGFSSGSIGGNSGSIGRANLDGTGSETIVSFERGLGFVSDIALAIQPPPASIPAVSNTGLIAFCVMSLIAGCHILNRRSN